VDAELGWATMWTHSSLFILKWRQHMRLAHVKSRAWRTAVRDGPAARITRSVVYVTRLSPRGRGASKVCGAAEGNSPAARTLCSPRGLLLKDRPRRLHSRLADNNERPEEALV